MSKFSLTLAALALAALPALAGGSRADVKWAHSWEEAMAEAKARNVPIHIGFHKDH